jgi:hypothetical protein
MTESSVLAGASNRTQGNSSMVDFIQISPAVRFAAAVLSPEWGTQYQPIKAAVPVDRPQHAEHRAGERRSEQMALI